MTQWNESQTKVLESLKDKKNILVSAAAGSGKTAVLVERIIRSIASGECSIDELLVVTFMREAAAQMKSKIIKALEELCAAGENENLVKQLAICDKADITTIDGFCNRIVKDNYNVAGLDPTYDFYDNAQKDLVRSDIMDECFEQWYNEDDGFTALSRLFMTNGYDDTELKDTIITLFNVSQSYADQKGFFQKLREEAETDDIMNTSWMKYLMSEINFSISDALHRLDKYRDFYCAIEGDNKDYAIYMVELIDADIDHFNRIKNAPGLTELKNEIASGFQKFSKKSKCINALGDTVEEYAAFRESFKKKFSIIPDSDELEEELEKNKKITIQIIDYTERYAERLLEEKKKNKKFEFGDIAHFAYDILHDPETGEPSRVAENMRDSYKYIYIDEYQDSNYLQEDILKSIARVDEEGRPCNIFMVGDVKQSIYRFRLAKPALFMDKSELYEADENEGRLINLNVNYRSRREILDATNYLFFKLMHYDLGRIEYDDTVKLNSPEDETYYKLFPQSDEELNIGGKPEIIIINGRDTDEESGEDSDENGEEEAEEMDENLSIGLDMITDNEMEAYLIAHKIKLLIDGNPDEGILPFSVKNERFDPELPESEENSRYRNVRYGDITILMNIVAGADGMVNILEKEGIPVTLVKNTGYFDAAEIMTMLSVLYTIDNARNDIPYTSVLLSHIGGMTESELALVVARRPKRRRYMYDMCHDFERAYIDAADEKLSGTAKKLERINGLIEEWRGLRSFITIPEMIDRILKDTKYDIFVSSMPEGKTRLANIRMLRFKAEVFEKSGFTSLFDFIRYIEKCKMHELDFGEAGTADVGNSVRITSIHKSKGLEYPVVILARTGKRFNKSEGSRTVVIDADYGIAHDVYKEKAHGLCIRSKGKKKEIIKSIMNKEIISEEIRLLYVAMTRAREKLIITGVTKDDISKKSFEHEKLMSSKCFLDMLIPLFNMEDVDEHYLLKIMDKKDIISSLIGDTISSKKITDEIAYDILKKLMGKHSAMDDPYDFTYAYGAAVEAASKTAVTKIEREYIEKQKEKAADEFKAAADKLKAGADELKAGADELKAGADGEDYYEPLSENAPDEASAGASDGAVDLRAGFDDRQKAAMRRGTVAHRIMELLDYGKINSREDMDKEIDRITALNFFTEEDRKNLNRKYILDFYSEDESSLFRRMKRADEKGLLFREKAFLMGMKPYEIPGMNYKKEDFGDDLITVQGVMDAFFYEINENGEKTITIVDYKTDKIRRPEELKERYSVQLYLYYISLSMITDAKINGIIFYSFPLAKEVDCSDAISEFENEI